jgi:rSAM/selenodomain-associated transferase 1
VPLIDPLPVVVIFARAPELGRVKTRLAATVGAPEALACYRAMGRAVVDAVRHPGGATGAARWRLVVAHTPADAAPALAAWLDPQGAGGLAYAPQADGDLGARMRAAVERAIADGAPRVVVVGTDCPDVDAAVVGDAFAALDTADVVLGPALDGGYYLVGVRAPADRACAALFEGVPWSAPDTLAVTLARAAAAGLSVARLAPLRDVDTADDWAWWRGR